MSWLVPLLKSSAKLQQAENSVVREQGGESMHKHQKKKKKKKVLAHIERMCDYFILWDSSCKWAENLQVQ